jgi:hypothetical protein
MVFPNVKQVGWWKNEAFERPGAYCVLEPVWTGPATRQNVEPGLSELAKLCLFQ